MPANGRRDLIRRLKVKELSMLQIYKVIQKSTYIGKVSARAVGEIGSFQATGLVAVDWPLRSPDFSPIDFYC